jgi:uncharacterized membrane protein
MSTPPDNQQKPKSNDVIPQLFTTMAGLLLMIGSLDNTYSVLAGLFLVLSATTKK